MPYGQVIPILGARRSEQLKDNLGCLDVTLTVSQLATLNDQSSPSLVFPHRMLRSPVAEKLTTGGQVGLLDNHRR